jgi:hypothetical protein
MSDHKEEIHRIRSVDSIEKPLLLHQVYSFDDPSHIRVASKVVKNTEGHDPQTLFGGKIAVWFSNVLEVSSRIIDDLHIGRDVSVSIVLCELRECRVSNVSLVELVVADCDNIVINFLEYDFRDGTIA